MHTYIYTYTYIFIHTFLNTFVNASWNWCNLADDVSTGYTGYESHNLVVRYPSLPITSRDDYTPKRIFGG